MSIGNFSFVLLYNIPQFILRGSSAFCRPSTFLTLHYHLRELWHCHIRSHLTPIKLLCFSDNVFESFSLFFRPLKLQLLHDLFTKSADLIFLLCSVPYTVF